MADSNHNAIRCRTHVPVASGTLAAQPRLGSPQAGFVLVATLVAIAVIALGAAYFAGQVDSLRNNARQMQSWAEAEREAFSVRETLMFAAAAGLRDEGGLNYANSVLATDGRPYRISETLKIFVQDERGLIGINTLDERLLARFLTSIGVPADQQPRLIDTLLDYMDPDDLRRLNGAEAAEYRRANLPPPTNDFLRTREQLRDLVAWRDLVGKLAEAEAVSPGIQTRFLDLFSTARHFGLNLNSASGQVLAMVQGIDPARVPALLDQRKARAFTSLAQLAPYTNGPIDEEYLGLIGAYDLRVTVQKEGLPFLLECQLTITAADADRPARLKECTRRPATATSSGLADEFRRALAPEINLRSTPETVPIRPSNFANRNDLPDARQPVESAIPSWLAVAPSPAGTSGR